MMIKTLLFSKLIILLLFSVSFAQKIPKVKRVALIAKIDFEDGKTGIEKLAGAYRIFDTQDCFPSQSSKSRISEIGKLIAQLKNPDLSSNEREKKEIYLKTSYEEQKRAWLVIFERRYKLAIEPVENEILASLKQFEIENNLIILDGMDLEEKGILLAWNEKINVTPPFIAYFNNKTQNPGEVMNLNLPASKIGLIYTTLFFDKQEGLKEIIKQKRDLNSFDKYCSKTGLCKEIIETIQNFADSKGYSLILDSSKNLPKEISELDVEDITQEFIINYNRNNP